MIKIVFIVGLVVIGLLAVKFMDEQAQKKVGIAFGVLLVVSSLSVIICELIR
ncbi:hypothetical protein [Candidatus Enterovibrio altilux]|uniref:Uncharacterized protein n=1 Tax=Candidatus Enterovibrio altilux TaxID=1927128 RepID=A0A291B797_9GAMM|nr:hypothetical protein [Candidatus Enterovibrio luxaltus]ATF08871.1 hypothetical protein BTN50_0335 [Candidatus Enterovibrio luxaltus]